MKIILVTREITPLSHNGGIGTAMYNLALSLEKIGCQVEVLYTGKPNIKKFFCTKISDTIKIHQLISPFGLLLKNPAIRSKAVLNYLEKQEFNFCFFHEYQGEAWWTLKAKKELGKFAKSNIGIITHGPSEWVDEGNQNFSNRNNRIHIFERYVCENADLLISPSKYLLEWMRGRNWKLPETIQVIPNFVADYPLQTFSMRKLPIKIKQISFFGRLEIRKGVDIFCEAINMLPEAALKDIQINFMGKEDTYTETAIRSWINKINKDNIRFFKHIDTVTALRVLRESGNLAVMPSRQENSPCVVAECLEYGIPFIASDVGGGPELSSNSDINFISPQADILATKILSCLKYGISELACPAWSNQALEISWRKLLGLS